MPTASKPNSFMKKGGASLLSVTSSLLSASCRQVRVSAPPPPTGVPLTDPTANPFAFAPITALEVTRATSAGRKTTPAREAESAARWTFVIGKDGKVALVETEVNPAGDAEAVLAAVRKLPGK